MTLKQKKFIIFDFDGTLINSIPDLTLATNKMLAHYSLDALTIEQVTPFIGNGAKPLVKRALEAAMQKTSTDAFLEEAFNVYFAAYKEEVCKDTFLYSNVLETLNYLKERGYKMAICTNKPLYFVAPILEKLQIKNFFECWIGEDSLPTKKPAAAPLLYLVEKANTTIANSIMIGDSKNDILAAKNAKMDSIGVSYGYNYNENIADYDPTIVIDHFDQLKTLF